MIPQLGDQFNYKDGQIFGHDCVLITPKDMGVDWNDENKHYRSVAIRKSDGRVISRGFSKFVNWLEWEFEARHKLDGSLALLSKIDGQIIFRTRGCFDARIHDNGAEEVDFLIQKYPSLFNNCYIDSENYTILCEWTTPSRVIVIRESSEPELILLGIIQNKSARLETQHNCDVMAESWGVKRPKKFTYSSVQECLDDVKAWQDKEGVVLYHEQSGTMKKIKADLYLSRHRLKSHISSISNLVDFYMTTSKSADYDEFFKVVEQSLDFELATQAAKDIQKVVDAHKQIVRDSAKVSWFLEDVRHDSRKEAAAKIIAKYNDWRKSYAFMALDNKPMPDKMLAELIIQTCKS
jgi:hypothetical protein